jgi:RimJ/RimL family protein N-acetyltransferase
MTENIGSQRVMEKCGLRFERTKIGKWEKFAEPVEQRMYVLRRDTKAMPGQ